MKTPDNNSRTGLPRRAVCYYRCASTNRSDQQRALDSQRAACLTLAANHGLCVTEESADLGEPGLNRFRLGLGDLVTFVRANAPVTVIVADTARLARSAGDLAWVRDQIEQTGSTILPATDDPDIDRLATGLAAAPADHITAEEHS